MYRISSLLVLYKWILISPVVLVVFDLELVGSEDLINLDLLGVWQPAGDRLDHHALRVAKVAVVPADQTRQHDRALLAGALDAHRVVEVLLGVDDQLLQQRLGAVDADRWRRRRAAVEREHDERERLVETEAVALVVRAELGNDAGERQVLGRLADAQDAVLDLQHRKELAGNLVRAPPKDRDALPERHAVHLHKVLQVRVQAQRVVDVDEEGGALAAAERLERHLLQLAHGVLKDRVAIVGRHDAECVRAEALEHRPRVLVDLHDQAQQLGRHRDGVAALARPDRARVQALLLAARVQQRAVGERLALADVPIEAARLQLLADLDRLLARQLQRLREPCHGLRADEGVLVGLEVVRTALDLDAFRAEHGLGDGWEVERAIRQAQAS